MRFAPTGPKGSLWDGFLWTFEEALNKSAKYYQKVDGKSMKDLGEQESLGEKTEKPSTRDADGFSVSSCYCYRTSNSFFVSIKEPACNL